MQNQNFRFFQNEAHRIIDTTGSFLYSSEKLAQSIKGRKQDEAYFFGANLAQLVLKLTKKNLLNSFHEQIGFHYSVQYNFKQDAGFVAYNKLGKQYKIKYFYFHEKQVMAHAIF